MRLPILSRLAAAPLLCLALGACETEGDRPADTSIGTGLPEDTGLAAARRVGDASTTARSAGGVVRVALAGNTLALAADTVVAGRTRFVLVNESAHSYALVVSGNGDEFAAESLPSGAMEMLIADLRPGTYTLRATAAGGARSIEASMVVR